jgi:hypothetical protein
MTARYDYYLVENTYVARYDRDSRRAERLMPDGSWVCSMATREIFDGRPLEDERDALETGAYLVARDKERAAGR